MHIFISRPPVQKLTRLIAAYRSEQVSYDNPKSTLNWQPSDFSKQAMSSIVDGNLVQRRRATLGWGPHAHAVASELLQKGTCFDLSWVDCVAQRPFQAGDTFCLLANSFGMWTANFCRVVYLETCEKDHGKLFSIGIGTLSRHAAVGEERLSVVWDRQNDRVDYLIGSISRPRTRLSRMLVKHLRRQQDRFVRGSLARLQDEISKELPSATRKSAPTT